MVYHSYVGGKNAPWLSSVFFLRKIGGAVNFEFGLGHFRHLGPHHIYKLHRFPTGHLGLALYDVANTIHPKLPWRSKNQYPTPLDVEDATKVLGKA